MSDSKTARALEIIAATLQETNGTADADLQGDTHLTDSGLLDSLDAMTFVFNLESANSIKFSDEEMFNEEFFKVSYLSERIAEKLA